MKNRNSFNSEDTIEINDQKFKYFNLNKVAEYFDTDLNNIPITIKIIIENLLRNEDGENINKDMIFKVFNSLKQINDKRKKIEIICITHLTQLHNINHRLCITPFPARNLDK